MSEAEEMCIPENQEEFFDDEYVIENDGGGYLNSYASFYAVVIGYIYLAVFVLAIIGFVLTIASFDCGKSCRPAWVSFLFSFFEMPFWIHLSIVLFLLVVFLLLFISKKEIAKIESEPKKENNSFGETILFLLKIFGNICFFLFSVIYIWNFCVRLLFFY